VSQRLTSTNPFHLNEPQQDSEFRIQLLLLPIPAPAAQISADEENSHHISLIIIGNME
jgi:hypothetical protein